MNLKSQPTNYITMGTTSSSNVKALEAFQKELPLRRAMRDTSGEAWSLNQIGECYSSLGEWKPALDNYNQALGLFKQVKDSHGEALCTASPLVWRLLVTTLPRLKV